jgi:predicted Zn finger-like uncharacterized protein
VKFSCDKCQTKYSIADEKVRGKVLKIRCKKCDNVIVLREAPAPAPVAAPVAAPSAAAQDDGDMATRAVALDPQTLAALRSGGPMPGAGGGNGAFSGGGGSAAVIAKSAPQESEEDSTRVFGQDDIQNLLKKEAPRPAVARAPAPPPAPPETEWFVAIKGQQVGPLTHAEVEAKIVAKQADDRTYGWCDGMGDWKRLAEIPAFRSFLANRRAPPPPVEPPAQEAVEPRAHRRAPTAREPSLDEMMAAEPSAPAGGDLGVADDVLAAMLAESATHTDAGAKPLLRNKADPFASVPAADGAEGPPRESTRMFIAAAGLANRASKHKVYAFVAVGCVGALAGVLYLDAAGIYEIPIAHELVSVGFAAMDAERPAKTRVVEDDDEDTGIASLFRKKDPAKKRRSGGAKLPTDGDALTGLADALKGAQEGGGVVLGERKGDGAATVAVPTSNLAKSDALKNLLNAPGRTQVDITKTAVGAPSTASSGPAKQGDAPLTAEQIGKVVADQKSSLSQCAMEAAKVDEKYKGTVRVTVTIGPSGKVMKVAVNDEKIRQMVLGTCLGRALMRWVFPAFKGEAFDAELPLKLSVGP